MKNSQTTRRTIFSFILLFVTAPKIFAGGDLDATFTTGVVSFGSVNNASANVVVAQPDGRVLVGGNFLVVNGQPRDGLARLNVDGTLDLSFNAGDTGISTPSIFAVAVQPDGRILVGGNFVAYNGVTGRNYLVRLNADGSLDTTFNQGGAGVNNQVNVITLQPDGRILVGGSFTNFNGTPRNRFARLNADGTLDTNWANIFANNVQNIAIQPDGQIIVIGENGASFGTGASNRRSIARLNASDGSIDLSFNPGTGADGVSLQGLALNLDGTIFVAGNFSNFNGTTRSALAKLNSDGSVNTGFAAVIGAPATVNVIRVLPDDQILIGGSFRGVNDSFRNGIARLNADGSVDETFDANAAIGNFFASSSVLAIAVQTDGRILVSGGGTNNSNIRRLNADGSLDTTFITGGAGVAINAIVIQPDGRIIIGGLFTQINGATGINRIARLNADGTRDTTFNTGTGFNSNVEDLALQSNGQIVVGGLFTSYNGTTGVNRIARLNADGTLDTAFTSNTDTGFDSNVDSLELQTDGRILVGGFFDFFNGASSNGIVRLNADGTRDTNFNVGTGFVQPVEDFALQPDGRILAVGAFQNYNGVTRRFLARLNTDGTLDASFRSGAMIPGGIQSLYAVGLQCDGRVIIGGNLQSYDNTPRFGIARITAGDTLTFTGAAGADWTTGANWTGGFAPTPTDNAVIPGNFTVNFSGGNLGVVILSIGTNATLTIANGSSLTIEDGMNNGTIAGAGTLNFVGNTLINNGTTSASAVNANLKTSCANSGMNPNKVLTGTGAFAGNVLTIASGVTLALQDNHQFNQINIQGTLDATSRTISLRGANPLQGAGSVVIPFSTFIFDGATAQTIAALNYHNLTLNNPAGATGLAGLVVQGLLRVQQGTFISGGSSYHDVQIDGGAMLAGTNAATINVSGEWTNNGTFTANGNTVSFSGSAAQTIGGASATDFNNLTINNSSGVGVSGTSTVANLMLSGGNLSTGANTLTITGTITRASGHVIGNVRKNLAAGNNFTFAVGTANGYSPVTIALTSGTTDVTASVTQSHQPALNPATSLHRYWTLTSSSGTAFTADLTFNYLQTDVFGNENIYRITRVAGGVPQTFANNCSANSPCVNTTANTAFISGVTQLSDWTLSEVAPAKRRRFSRGSR